MIKFRLYFDKDKETAWLNRMAEEGYAMTGFFAGFYTFEECEPGKYTYQVDFGNKFFSVENNYREFMEEQNVEIVQSWGYWIILRKKAAEGEFNLYTDVDSQIAHYTKIRNMFKVVTILELICFIVECICASMGSTSAIYGAILIGILTLVVLRAVIHTNGLIAELKERKGEYTEACIGKASPILVAGMLLNCCTFGIKGSVSDYIVTTIQIAAIALMLIGLYRSRNIFKN